MVEPLIVVVHSHRQDTLCLRLTNDIVVENFAYFTRCRNFAFLAAGKRSLGFFTNDVVAKLNALITDENGWASDQFADFVL
jgi:hypothetical protein